MCSGSCLGWEGLVPSRTPLQVQDRRVHTHWSPGCGVPQRALPPTLGCVDPSPKSGNPIFHAVPGLPNTQVRPIFLSSARTHRKSPQELGPGL